MKKLLLIAFTLFAIASKAQILISNNFDGYNGLLPSVAPGWYYSFNDSTAATRSYYTSVATSGLTVPAYKFGHDTVTMITPSFTNADSLRFWMKGNAGTYQPINHFTVLESTDSVTWVQTFDMDSISATGTIYTIPLNAATKNLKFVYHKDSLGYNVGIDDIYVFRGSFNGIKEVEPSTVSIYPNPTKGRVTLDLGNLMLHNVTISVLNILGKEVNTIVSDELRGTFVLDLGTLDDGIYMLRVKSDKTEIVKRLILRK